MDVQLKELIDKIKNDGVKSAEDTAKKIVAEAETKAEEIIKLAEKNADSLKENAQKEAELTKQSSVDAVKQSSRDLVIDLKKEIQTIFDNLIKIETEKTLKGDALANAIIAVLTNWKQDNVDDLSVLLPTSEEKNVKDAINSKFSDLLKSGLEIKTNPSLTSGFKLSEKNGNVYYDFSAEGIGEMMAEYLSPSLAHLVKDVKES